MMKRDPSYVHPSFPQPKDTSMAIWRYMDFYKFEWFVNNSRLYLPRSDNLGEPLEGSTPQGEVDWWDQKMKDAESDKQRNIIEHNRDVKSRTAKEFREYYYVSCWHCNEFENSAMWHSYTNSTKALAFKTTYSLLRDNLSNYVEMGLIRYIDYSKERLPFGNMFEHIMHKDKFYTFENEVRAVAASFIADKEWREHFNENLFESEKYSDSFSYQPKVNVRKLVVEIILHPDMSKEHQADLINYCEDKGLSIPKLSRSLQKPVF